MFNLFREAARDVSLIETPLPLREFRPHKLFYPRPFEFKPLPPGYKEALIFWRRDGDNWPLPYLEVLLELDLVPIFVGGVTMFLYSYISQDISYGYHYTWPSAHNAFEACLPIERITAYLWVRTMILSRYATRFVVGGGIYMLLKRATYMIIGNRLSTFRTNFLCGTLFSMFWANNYSHQRPVWKVINGLWTGIGMAYSESVFDAYFYAINNLSSSDMPFRVR